MSAATVAITAAAIDAIADAAATAEAARAADADLAEAIGDAAAAEVDLAEAVDVALGLHRAAHARIVQAFTLAKAVCAAARGAAADAEAADEADEAETATRAAAEVAEQRAKRIEVERTRYWGWLMGVCAALELAHSLPDGGEDIGKDYVIGIRKLMAERDEARAEAARLQKVLKTIADAIDAAKRS